MGVSAKITHIRADGGYAMTGNQCNTNYMSNIEY